MLILHQDDANTKEGFQDQDDNWIYRPKFTETASTAANLKNYGLTEITSTAAKTYTLDAPFLGARKILCNTGSTTVQSVVAGSTVNGISVGATSTHRKVTFNSLNGSIELIGVSTSQWLVVSNNSATVTSS